MDRRYGERRASEGSINPEVIEILRLISDIQLKLSESNDPEERDGLFAELREATARSVNLVYLPNNLQVGEKE
jgi:hypothetical protein